MWVSTAIVVAGSGIALLAGVMAYLGVVERESRIWRLWAISFAFLAARSFLLVELPAEADPLDAVAEVLGITQVAALVIGTLLWSNDGRAVPALAVGAVLVAVWAVASAGLNLPHELRHLPTDLLQIVPIGLAAWALWTGGGDSDRVLRRLMSTVLLAWSGHQGLSAALGWHEDTVSVGHVVEQAYAMSLGLLLIVAAHRARQAELDRVNRRLTDFVQMSSDWLWEQDADLRFSYMSDSVWQHAAVRPEDNIGRTRRETAPLGLSDEDWAAHEAVLQRREPFKDLRYYRLASDGRRRYLSVSGMPMFDDTGVFQGYRGIGRDMTDMILAEQRVNDVHARLLQAIEARSEGVACWDRDDRLVICNHTYREQSGAAGAALVPGVRFVEYLRASVELGEVPAAVGREEAWITERLERRKNLPYAFELFRNGRWLLIREQRTPDGGVLLTATDISELKHRESELIAAATEAQLANRAKMAFLATMSHELRTPLNAIIGFAEIIRTGQLAARAEVQAEYAGYIHESGSHLLAVINDLLDVSRIEAGRLTLEERPFALASLLEECDRLVRQKATSEGLRFAVTAVDPGLGVRGDRRALKQVLINLLSNAIKFTGSGGAVTLIAERDPQGDLRIVVNDTGIGVEADRLSELFEPFRQIENVHARRHHGTGLGLYISKSLVEAHGGTIAFESKPGQGSTVTVTLSADRLFQTGGAARRAAV